ncbi:helix-turn-helix transcriptional regulator [bacterium]|nr:helix-turn-helix transcriptional regulator [bacterium]
MNIKKQLGAKVKRLRQKRGFTQEQFAEKIDIATRTLSGIETGENFVTSETLGKMLDVLDITSSELFAFDHIKPQDDLKEELLKDIQNLTDRNKIETVYKVVKAVICD